MYLVMQETEAQSHTVCLIKRWDAEKKKSLHAWVRNRRRKTSKRGKDTKKRKKIVSQSGKGTACMRHAMRSTDKHLFNLDRGKSASIPWLACDSCYVWRPNFTTWILALLVVGGRETESEWMKGRDRKVRLTSCCWTVGDKVKEKEKEKDVDKKENET